MSKSPMSSEMFKTQHFLTFIDIPQHVVNAQKMLKSLLGWGDLYLDSLVESFIIIQKGLFSTTTTCRAGHLRSIFRFSALKNNLAASSKDSPSATPFPIAFSARAFATQQKPAY